MKSIELYLKGIIFTFETLFKGKFLIYFLPGFIVSLFLWYYYYQLTAYQESVDSTKDIWLIGGMLSWTMNLVGELFSFIIEQLYIFVILVLFSPFNSILSEKFDNYITGNKFEGGILRMANDLLRAIFIAIIAIILECLFIGVYGMLTFLIPDSFEIYLSPVMYYIIPAFFIGFAFFDYSLERYGEGTFSSWGYAFSRILTMILAGSLFVLIYNIPMIGIILAPVILTMLTTYVYIYREGKHVKDTELSDQIV